MIRLAYGITRMQPGCVPLQAAMGGDSQVVSPRFDHRTWLVAPTPDLKVYLLTEEQLEQAIAASHEVQRMCDRMESEDATDAA